MIPRDFITEWRAHAPWVQDLQVEQDLVISRALVELFSKPALRESLAFRGGTALYKLHVRPAARYSEDIDLVQTRPEPIGGTLDAIREALDPWLGTPQRKVKAGSAALIYRFPSEDAPPVPLRLKIEINSREHFSVFALERATFEVTSRWFGGRVEIPTFVIDELLGTKLRALYQRKKGRDLFDLALALARATADPARIVVAFQRYMAAEDSHVTRAMFEQNLHEKLTDPRFTADIAPLLAPGHGWDLEDAAKHVLDGIITHLPGEPWRQGIR
jgi:predicted nucleotidyltransferase component of viral defense system